MADYDETIVRTIVDMYQVGMSVASIADELEGVSIRGIREVLQEAGALGRDLKSRGWADQVDQATLEAMLSDYDSWMPMNEIAAKYDISSFIIYDTLRKLGRPARSYSKEAMVDKAERLQLALDYYRQGMPIWQICEETGIQQVKLHHELHTRKIPLRRQPKAWKERFGEGK